MYNIINENDISLFNKPHRILISGFSGSGKSFFTSNLIKKYRSNFKRVIVIGSDLENVHDLNVERLDDFNPFDLDEGEIGEHILLIFDDIIYQKKLLKLAGEVFIRGRHLNISCILLTQNLFINDPNFRTLALNVTHLILFRMRCIVQLTTFARTFLNKTEIESFLKLYKKIVLGVNKYGYLLVDFTTDSESILKLRSNIIGEEYERSYVL